MVFDMISIAQINDLLYIITLDLCVIGLFYLVNLQCYKCL